MYYRGANIILIVFDITERTSFERAIAYYREVNPVCSTADYYLIANKTDLANQRVVSTKVRSSILFIYFNYYFIF